MVVELKAVKQWKEDLALGEIGSEFPGNGGEAKISGTSWNICTTNATKDTINWPKII